MQKQTIFVAIICSLAILISVASSTYSSYFWAYKQGYYAGQNDGHNAGLAEGIQIGYRQGLTVQSLNNDRTAAVSADATPDAVEHVSGQ